MLVRQCNRCKKDLARESYWKFEETHYKPNGGFSCCEIFDLCESCYKELQKFLTDCLHLVNESTYSFNNDVEDI